jgi:glycosyltransferase involved in cell wall biosynthesis
MRASVLIPTRNRRESLLRTLRALRDQRHGGPAFEIIVSFDRCTDESAEAVQREFPGVRTTQIQGPGPSAALNAAARLASAPLLIFLDDDMEPVPEFVAEHVAAHRETSGAIAVAGRIVPVVVTRSVFSDNIEAFYQNFDREMAAGELAASPHGLPGGNASIKTDDFRAVGGVDERYEFMKWDFELAARLLERGFRLVYARSASATTYLQLTTAELLSRAAKRAASDVRLARDHPWSVPYLELRRAATRDDLRGLMLWHGASALRAITSAMRPIAPLWPSITRAELVARYWSELRRQLGTRDALRALAANASGRAPAPAPIPAPSPR